MYHKTIAYADGSFNDILDIENSLNIQIMATEGLPNYSESYQAKLTLCSNLGTVFFSVMIYKTRFFSKQSILKHFVKRI